MIVLLLLRFMYTGICKALEVSEEKRIEDEVTNVLPGSRSLSLVACPTVVISSLRPFLSHYKKYGSEAEEWRKARENAIAYFTLSSIPKTFLPHKFLLWNVRMKMMTMMGLDAM